MNSPILGLLGTADAAMAAGVAVGPADEGPRANEFNSNSKVEVDEPNFTLLRRWCSLPFSSRVTCRSSSLHKIEYFVRDQIFTISMLAIVVAKEFQ